MVSIQDIGLQLTKPVKELAQWNFPFSETLNKYCSLFNTTCSKSFGEAGLVLQNSAAVYVHRIDSLWNKTEDSRNLLVNYENEEITQKSAKKRERKTDMCFQNFKTVDFAKEVDKNINIKKNQTHTVKSKNRCFTQLEKGIAQHVSIDIYDVNGEIIGKKYDFRCNQNINVDGVLVDAMVEFASQDFGCDDDDDSESLSTPGCTMHDDNDQNASSDAESERNNDDSLEEEVPDTVTSSELTQQTQSFSENSDTNTTLIETPNNTLDDNCHNVTPDGISNEMCLNTLSDTNLSITQINNNCSNNIDLDDNYLNNDIRKSIDVGSLLDSPPESVNSKDRRTSSTDDLGLISDTNEELSKIHLATNIEQKTPKSSTKNKIKQSPKSISKSVKRKFSQTKKEALTANKKGQGETKKNLVHLVEEPLFLRRKRGGPNMFNKSLSTCIKCIQECNPLQYNDVTNVDLDLLGFQLCVNEEANTDISDNEPIDTSINEVSRLRSPSPMDSNGFADQVDSPLHENFCDTWLRPDSPQFLPRNVDKWHEMIQPKLREAEQRSTFCVHDYATRIVTSLKANDQRKINFDAIIQNEHEVARYFLALLDLAAKQNVDLHADNDLKNDIEIVLREKDTQCVTNDQVVDSPD